MTHPPGEDGWQRLDPRMMLIHPIRELLRFLPVLLGLFVAGTASGGVDVRWQVLGLAVPVLVGLLRYLTTSFRVTDGRVELRRGLVNKHVLSTRLERVRTVDVTASLFHRVLGLATVRIGTGTASTSEEDHLDLDGLRAPTARALRDELLHSPSGPAPLEGAPEGRPADRLVLVLDPAWSRYAPLTSSGFALGAVLIGIGSQVLDGLGLIEGIDLEALIAGLDGLLLLPALLAGVVTVCVLAVAAYLVANWDFTVSHAPADRTWHLRRGLLTTRETSLDDERVAGVTIGEPLGLRLARGGRLSAIVTGLDRKESGSSTLVPPAPRRVVAGVAAEVLGTSDPVLAPLRRHGPRARNRRFSRALVPAGLVAAAAVLLVLAGASPAWLVLAGVVLAGATCLAVDRARSLGHALVDGHLVVRSGSLFRQREVLETTAIIGLTFRSTWFQRRAGLTTLVATMAGGSQSVTALDVPAETAVGVASAAVPNLVDQFVDADVTTRG